MHLVPSISIEECTLVRKLREMPAAGEILCKVGEHVTADQIVGIALGEGEITIVRVAEELDLDSAQVMRLLKVKVGDRVSRGQIIACRSLLWGLIKTNSFATLNGTVEFISKATGHLGLRQAAEAIDLHAYISGEVVEVNQGSSLVIESYAALVQGIFGVGGERVGMLELLNVAADRIVLPSDLPGELMGKILLGGASPTVATLNAAALGGAVGFICGSIDDQTLAQYLGYDIGIALTGDEKVPMTVIVTEGFGHIPISERVIRLLSRFNARETSINGSTQVRAGAIRPEIIVPLRDDEIKNASKVQRPLGKDLQVGVRIRMIRYPHFGVSATVTELPQQQVVLDTGAAARVLRAQLDDGRLVTVPRSNVEIY